MALQSAVIVPASQPAQKAAGLAVTTSSGELVFGFNTIIAINADQDISIAFGQAGMAAAAATNFRVPQNQTIEFDLGQTFDRIRVFNLSGTTAANIYILPVSRF